ncbi:hypothetical protein HYT25_00895 [Candidatus Pacearchaeota archaeon]|nr:hypothetical protein [Candidatus Pacearchaeota archaeon]
MSVWNETIKPFSEEVKKAFIDAAKDLEEITQEEFEKKRRERQENCLHDGKIYSFGPALVGENFESQTYFCCGCGLSTDEPIGKYKGTKPMSREDFNRILRNTYVD